MIKAHAPLAPVLLVGTHAHEKGFKPSHALPDSFFQLFPNVSRRCVLLPTCVFLCVLYRTPNVVHQTQAQDRIRYVQGSVLVWCGQAMIWSTDVRAGTKVATSSASSYFELIPRKPDPSSAKGPAQSPCFISFLFATLHLFLVAY